MKLIKILLAMFILSISISCDKDNEPTLTLAADLQNGYWEEAEIYELKTINEFDGTNNSQFNVDKESFPNSPCIDFTVTHAYTIEGNMITIGTDDPVPIKVEGDVLTIDGDYKLNRIASLTYPDCE